MTPEITAPTCIDRKLSADEMPLTPGCSCKVLAPDMEAAFAAAWNEVYPDRCGESPAERPQDCAVVHLGGITLLLTQDFAPVVASDLELAGRIAALHALSDVFAVGGTPMWAGVLFVEGPGATHEKRIALEAGILRACKEEGVLLTGGQSIVSKEWMAGLALIGVPGPYGLLTKRGARDGDRLLVSKPLGCGAVLHAHSVHQLADADLAEAFAVMTTSNRTAAEKAGQAGVHAATDITGFGLAGCVGEMLAEDDLGASVTLSRIPLIEAARGLDDRFGSRWIDANHAYARKRRRMIGVRDRNLLMPMLNPETNGPLMVAADERAAALLVSDGAFSVIGDINRSGKIEVLA
jgi:selenide,water dikinase